MDALEEMTGHAEKVLSCSACRTVAALCTGDMGFGACKPSIWKCRYLRRTPTVKSPPALTSGISGASYAGTLPQQVRQEKPVWCIP